MLSFLKSRAQIRAVHEFLRIVDPSITDRDPVLRVARVIGRIKSDLHRTQAELDAMKRKYEPTRMRVVCVGGTFVQSVGAAKSPPTEDR